MNKKTIKKVSNFESNDVKVEKDMKKRVVRGSFSTIMVCLVIAIVIVLNIVASLVETDLGLKLDLTSNKMYTLSPLTENIVKNIEKELTIYSFANDNEQDIVIQKTIERYAALNSKIQIKVVDPARDVALQRKFSTESVTVQDGTLVLTDKDEQLYRVITYNDMYTSTTDETGTTTGTYWVLEQKLTAAFMFMSNDIQTNVYLLTGHGEKVTDPSYKSAVTTLCERLEEENYNVQNIDLALAQLKQGDILMVIGPKTDLTDEERDILTTFLDNRGKALFFFDPTEKELTNFYAVLDHYMVKVKNETLYDSDAGKHTDNSFFELVPDFVSSDITQGLINSDMKAYVDNTLFFEEYTFSSGDATFIPLMETSQSSVSIPYQDLANDAYKDKMGEYVKEGRNIGFAYKLIDATSMQNDAQTRICAFGSSEIILGKRQNSAGNITLVKNCVNWVDNKTSQLAITGPQIDNKILNIPNAAVTRTILIVAIIVIPILIISGGIIIWYRRKNL